MSPPASPARHDGKIKSATKPETPLQAPGRPDPEQFAHDQTQVARCHLDQVPFPHFFEPTQPTPAAAARFTDVGETPFHALAPQTLQFLAALAAHPPPIAKHRRFLFRRFVRPTAAFTTLLFGNVSSPTKSTRLFQRAGLVITFVRHRLLDLRRTTRRFHVQL